MLRSYRSVGLCLFLALVAAASSTTGTCQTLTVLHDFTGGGDGAIPAGGLTIDASGRLYGTAHIGGDISGPSCGGIGCGIVFQLTRAGSSWALNPLHQFTGADSDGASPTATLVFGPDGKLYGTTLAGGSGPCSGNFSWPGCGTVFSISPPARACERAICPWDETVLYSFTGAADGAYPGFGALALDQAGNLYGATRQGGALGQGAVYELSRSNGAWTELTLYSFAGGGDGSMPNSGVIFDSAGNLYGTTHQGGSSGDGTVFELVPAGSGWSFRLLWTFTGGTDGRWPFGGLIFGGSGDLFGSTSSGGGAGGTIFEMTSVQGMWTLNTIQNLEGYLTGDLALDQAGSFYGQTVGGGAYGNGEVFKLTSSPNNWTLLDLHDFMGSDGVEPFGDILLSNGTLYGVTEYGGPYHCQEATCGVAWELTQ